MSAVTYMIIRNGVHCFLGDCEKGHGPWKSIHTDIHEHALIALVLGLPIHGN
ncbi:hypothetical protein BC629DRAFT_1484447 [Irpex lacteus]|nr:hypothetical protein BC629DRAFT_1484447 [Irpex lacteus]